MKKRVISVFTATRAEYHLLYRVIKRIADDPTLELDLIVSGTHLSEKYGHTIDAIIEDGFKISDKIETITEQCSVDSIISKTLIGTSQHFTRVKSDFLIVLGDRYELMGVVIAAANAHVPIAHIHGGETTIGAIDEAVRHAVSKFSYLHFTSCEAYRKRVIQLGEHPSRVFNCGALGVENILNQKLLTREELEKSLGFSLKQYAVVTYHPVTLEDEDPRKQISELFAALSKWENMSFIITKANADKGGDKINEAIDEYAEKKDNVRCVASLGLVRYLSALKYSKMVIGNSSSGIIEAPSFCIPTINIGDRQKGRIRCQSVIDCEPREESIVSAMEKAMDAEFLKSIQSMPQIYGDGSASSIIVSQIKKTIEQGVQLKKSFYDIVFEEEE